MTKSIKFKRELKPGLFEYGNMGHEFRPFVQFTNEDNYRTKIVNTDRLGFRKTFFKNKLLGIDDLKKNSSSQNIIIGGSTAFGMGSTSDKTTISSFLNSQGSLWFSLGVRGAVGRQELITLLSVKNFFPKIKNIIILSGINDLAMCAGSNSMYYNDFGGMMGSPTDRFYSGFLQSSAFSNSNLTLGRAKLFHFIFYLSNKSKFFKFLLVNLFSKFRASKLQIKTKKISTSLNFKKKLANLKKITENDFQTWSAIANQFNINLVYILQPGITWTKKKPTNYEEKIIAYEKIRIKKYSNHDFSKKNVYLDFKNFLKTICSKNSIKFYDGNELILKAKKNQDFFIDFAHLSDYGNSFIAKTIMNIIKKK